MVLETQKFLSLTVKILIKNYEIFGFGVLLCLDKHPVHVLRFPVKYRMITNKLNDAVYEIWLQICFTLVVYKLLLHNSC